MSRSVITGVRTPEYMAKLKAAFNIMLENHKTMAMLDAINATAQVMKLDTIDRNLLVDIYNAHKRKLKNG